MHRRLCTRKSDDAEGDFDRFKGQLIVVDLAEVDGRGENFEGAKWLENKLKDREPIGWDLEWPPDRVKDSNNPIALMQFADDTTALLIRTHRTERFLPRVVKEVLASETCMKICVGWDGADKKKMKTSFDLEPGGLLDLATLASQKGVKERGLKSLADRFGYKMKKETRVARSDWATVQLTKDQTMYAAEDAYFTFLLKEKLEALPSVENDDDSIAVEGQLALRDGWKEQGIIRRHDGLYCNLCSKGPMNTHENVLSHLKGRDHEKKREAAQGLGPGGVHVLKEEEEKNGIFAGDGTNGVEIGEFRCRLCPDAQLKNYQSIEAHIKSKKHQKALNPEAETTSPGKVKDPFERLWNLPDYVELKDQELICTLCTVRLPTVTQMYMHLQGNTHHKKARAAKLPDVIWIQARNQLEYTLSGRPVKRTGFKSASVSPADSTAATSTKSASSNGNVASNGKVANDKDGSIDGNGNKVDGSARPKCPEGWGMSWDESCQRYYYWQFSDRSKTQWEHPSETPAKPSKPARSAPSATTAGSGGTKTTTTQSSEATKTPAPQSSTAVDSEDEWEEHQTDDGHKFYYHLKTKTSHWLRSTAPATSTCGARDDDKKSAMNDGYPTPAAKEKPLANSGGNFATEPLYPEQADTLQPGWREVVDEKTGKVFFWDGETQSSSWLRPVYYHQSWKRRVAGEGAYWVLAGSQDHASMSFWESDASWDRRQDHEGNIYWSNQELQIRFFELDPFESDLEVDHVSSAGTDGWRA